MDPILKSRAKRFLIAKLGGNLPIRDFFPTIAHHVPHKRAFTFGRIANNGVIRYGCLAIWAYNLVFHLFSFRSNDNFGVLSQGVFGHLHALEKLVTPCSLVFRRGTFRVLCTSAAARRFSRVYE